MTNYLPGIGVTINDSGLKLGQPPAGPKVTLLGVTSNTGLLIREPYTIASVEKAMNSLYFDFSGLSIPGGLASQSGRVPGELALAVEEVSAAGTSNIEVMIIGCYSGSYLQDYLRADIDKTGRYLDLSGAYDILRNRELDVVVPVGVYMDDLFTGSLGSTWNFGKQLANFCFQATAESSATHGVIGVRPVLEWATCNRTGLLPVSSSLSGELVSLYGMAATGQFNTNALIAQQFKANAFSTASTALVNSWQTYMLGDGVGLYNPTFTAWLAGAKDQFGNKLSAIDVNTASSVNSAYFPYWQAVDSDGVVAFDSRGVKVDAGAYISVFAAPLRHVGTLVRPLALALGASPALTSRNTSAAAAYAGKILSLAPQSGTTFKAIDGLTQLKLLSARQANDLLGMRYVTMYSRTKGLVVAQGVTGAYNVSKYVRSDFVNLTTVRIVAAVVDLIRAVGDKYIGESNDAARINAFDADVQQVLGSMKGAGALRAADYSISSSPDERVLGIINVNLTIVPAFEIVKINLTVSLSKGE